MASSKKSTKSSTATNVEKTTLENPFPSAPKNPAKHELRITYGDKQQYILTFGAAYSAKKFIEQVLGDDNPLEDLRWPADDRVTNNDGASKFDTGEWVIISIPLKGEPSLKDLLTKYKYSAAEKAWELPAPYTHYAAAIRGEVKKLVTPPDDDKSAADQKETAPVSKKSDNKTPDTKKSTSVGKKKEVASDEVTAGELAAQMNVEPSKFRGALRQIMETPAGGWVFKKSQGEKIKAQVAEKLKSAAVKK
jgi:hypothetical protein